MTNVREALIHYTITDDLVLSATAYGEPGENIVLFAHGGGQTRFSWGNTARALAEEGWYAIAYDHRGHGESSWVNDKDYALPRFAEDLHALVAQLPAKPVVVGASLGGMSAMLAEGENTEELFRAVILVDITPRMNDEGAKGIIGFMMERVEEGFGSLEEAADVIAEFTQRPKRKNVDGLRKNLRLDDDGRYRWHWDPAFAQQRHGVEHLGLPERLEAAVQNISAPMLLIRGARSNLVTEELAQEFLRQVPHAEQVDVANAHHMVAGDRNDIFSAAVIDFVQRV
ncbi:MAG: alpha/beta fold hydrolase [Pseudomonadales bacterium]